MPQVIAWEDKDGSNVSTPSSGAAVGSILRYGVVVVSGGGSAETGDGGGDDDDVPGDGRGSGRVGEGLRHVRVKLTPGRVDTLLSSQVCAFLDSRERRGERLGSARCVVCCGGKRTIFWISCIASTDNRCSSF